MSADAYRLLWEDGPRHRGRPAGLSREAVVAEAVTLADRVGLDGLSMKRIAAELGCGVMSLYRHVPAKSDLTLLMYDVIFAEPPLIPESENWRGKLTAWARQAFAVFEAHRWALTLAVSNRPIGPAEMRWFSAAVHAVEDLELSASRRVAAILTVANFVRGAVPAEPIGRESATGQFAFQDNPDARREHPEAAALLADLSAREDPELENYFEFGLSVVLDGLERRAAAG